MQINQLMSLMQPAAEATTPNDNDVSTTNGSPDFLAIINQIRDSNGNQPSEVAATPKPKSLSAILSPPIFPESAPAVAATGSEARSGEVDKFPVSPGQTATASLAEPAPESKLPDALDSEDQPTTLTAVAPVTDVMGLPGTSLVADISPAEEAITELPDRPAAAAASSQSPAEALTAKASGANAARSLIGLAEDGRAVEFRTEASAPAHRSSNLWLETGGTNVSAGSNSGSATEESVGWNLDPATGLEFAPIQAGSPVEISEPLASGTPVPGNITRHDPTGSAPLKDAQYTQLVGQMTEAGTVASEIAENSAVAPDALLKAVPTSDSYSPSTRPNAIPGNPASPLPGSIDVRDLNIQVTAESLTWQEPKSPATPSGEACDSAETNANLESPSSTGTLPTGSTETIVKASFESALGQATLFDLAEARAMVHDKSTMESTAEPPARCVNTSEQASRNGAAFQAHTASGSSASSAETPETTSNLTVANTQPGSGEEAGAMASASDPVRTGSFEPSERTGASAAKHSAPQPLSEKDAAGQAGILEPADGKALSGQAAQSKNAEKTQAEPTRTFRSNLADGREETRDVMSGLAISADTKPGAMPKTTSTSTPRPAEFVYQLADRIQNQLQSGQGELRIHLKPEHLGNLEIKAESGADGIVARIAAESNNVKQYLESNLHLLQQSLHDHGLKVDRIDVVLQAGLDLRNTGSQNHQSGQAGDGHTGTDPDPSSGSRAVSPLRESEMDVDPITSMVLGPNSTFHTVA